MRKDCGNCGNCDCDTMDIDLSEKDLKEMVDYIENSTDTDAKLTDLVKEKGEIE